uniref:Ubiquitin carboxyl-terminal hydrolase n=1 Tax=Pyxicephalus adspersus TaxID=30357 RepID=A0AAV3A7H9_PYXAD|nr:TPA: hypothetical protein GDO54_015263 [Pyxicephalus adspersus]
MTIGAGLQNLGNTCFVNSVLQCLTHTEPLADYMISQEHSNKCRSKQFCLMCVMENHINTAVRQSGKVITPNTVIDNLPSIAGHFIRGRQEDAHEFLCYAIDKMKSSCINDNVSIFSSEQPEDNTTNLIDHLFAGSLRSQVICQNCKHTSERHEEFLDINLDINSSKTVLQSLKNFVKVETMKGDNAYRCGECNQLVTAKKRSTIHKPPNIMTISLKRFDMFTGSKLTKKIKYPKRLNITQCTSDRKKSTKYDLYAVLVHIGSSCQSGHYYAYVKDNSDRWYLMNDSQVTSCKVTTVLNQEAYLLFYTRAPTQGGRVQPARCRRKAKSSDAPVFTPRRRNVTSGNKDTKTPARTRDGVKIIHKAEQDSSIESVAKRRRTDSNSAFQLSSKTSRKRLCRKRRINDTSGLGEKSEGQSGLKHQTFWARIRKGLVSMSRLVIKHVSIHYYHY